MAQSQYNRSEFKTGDLVVWSTRGVKSIRDLQLQVVRFMTRSEYDHVGIVVEMNNRLFVVEATPPRVRLYPLSKMLPLYHLPLSLNVTQEAINDLFSHIGEEYSVWQAFISYFTKPKKDNKWQCVEFCDHWYREVMGLDIEHDYTPSGFVLGMMRRSQSGLRYYVSDTMRGGSNV